ncbi:hypothetical protein [Sansalvadorimonas verongulae]|uniref:hypothetical protein n=1 Tax=Sansalvadorimonas verongulae TaxID=2172824 RepID=UPI0012BD5517|nr:hypothetical protein [Sansalvadorimonas verongulae]MTI11825.1 hypothetical protein [Sansalvadorimonas verongulae]
MSIVLKQCFLCFFLILPALPVWAATLETNFEMNNMPPLFFRLGTWSGQSGVEKSHDGACIIARDASSAPVHYDLSVMDMHGENFALRTGSSVLPVTFTIKGTGAATSSLDEALKRNSDSIEIQGNPQFTRCADYGFSITMRVQGSDIVDSGSAGYYNGEFQLKGVVNGKQTSSKFYVQLKIINQFQVTQVKDIAMTKNNISGGWLQGDMDFCVYAVFGGNYKMSVDSQLRPGRRFELQNGVGGAIPYRVNIRYSDLSKWTPLLQRGESEPGTLVASNKRNCGGSPNVRIRIDTPESKIPSALTGLYRDVQVVTVGPE